MNLRGEALAAAIAAGIFAGVPIGLGDRPSTHADETRSGVRFNRPAHYEPADLSVEQLAGALLIADARADAPAPGHPGATAIVGVTPPSALQLARREPVAGITLAEPPRLVVLGPEVAVRIRGSAVSEDGKRWHVTMYVVAGNNNDVTLACASQEAVAVTDDSCEHVATTLNIPASFGAVPETRTLREYRTGLDSNMLAYDRRAAAHREALARARTPQGQALQAGRLAALCAGAVRQLSALPGNPLAGVAQLALAKELTSEGSEYERMARAAEIGGRGGYMRARAAIQRVQGILRTRTLTLWRVANFSP